MSFHLYEITEVYSNAHGNIQFIELFSVDGGQQFLAGHQITSTSGGVTHTYNFTTNLPGDSANTSVLIATQSFADLNLVEPDYIVPDGFLFTTDGTVNFAGVDSLAYDELPTDGTSSYDHDGVVDEASPTNFAGDSSAVTGVEAGEVFIGTDDADSIVGGDGFDALYGEAGNDTLEGGDGDDVIEGVHGSDVIRGGLGDDLLGGDRGTGFGNDRLFGDAGNDTLAGDEGSDTLDGGSGSDRLFGGIGNDNLNGGAGVDNLQGEGGNDTMLWSSSDSFNGGAGNLDTLRLASGNLNLVTTADSKILNTEQINMAGGGSSTLTVNKTDVLALSSTVNTLKIFGDGSDTVDLRGAFVEGSTSGGFVTYQNGAAIVRIDQDINVI